MKAAVAQGCSMYMLTPQHMRCDIDGACCRTSMLGDKVASIIHPVFYSSLSKCFIIW